LGAESLLGSSLFKFFHSSSWEVTGVVSSEKEGHAIWDYKDETVLRALLKPLKPDVVVYCANSLTLEECERNPDLAKEVLVNVTDRVSRICREIGSWSFFVSSELVFDGSTPPYSSNSETNPKTIFGKYCLEGELILWKNQPDAGVLRVPMLYGSIQTLGDNEFSQLVKVVLDKKPVKVNDSRIQHPTFVDDISYIIKGLAERKMAHCGLYGTWHWSNYDSISKYQFAVRIAEILGVSHEHITPEKTEDSSKPLNCELNVIALEVMGLGIRSPMTTTLKTVLESFSAQK